MNNILKKIKYNIKHEYIVLKKKFLYQKIIIHNKLFRNNKRLNICDDENLVIVSLTTISSRINKVWITIESIFMQSYKNIKIILYLDKNKFNDNNIPENLKKQKNRGLEIKYCEDLICHTKYYYTVKDYGNYNIVTIDDDILYPKNMISELVKVSKKNPNCIICHRAHEIIFKKNGEIEKYNNWNWGGEGVKGPTHSLLQTGVSGVLYPPNSLDKEVLDKEKFKKLCPKADDIWLKFMALKNGTKVVKVKENSVHFPVIDGTQEIALNKYNVSNDGNDKQIKALLNEYGFTKEDFYR